MNSLALGVVDKSVFRHALLLVALSAATSPVFAESTFLGGASLGDTGFYVGAIVPFATDMVFKWQVGSPQEYFSVDTQGQEWYIQGQLGMQRFDPPYAPEGLTLRDMTINLVGETGNLSFDRLISINSTWPGVDGYWPLIPITGAGTFTSISFRMGFENVPPQYLGVPVESIVGASSYTSSSFTINGDGGSVVVVPEPSTYSMALAGLACGGFSIWRRRRRHRRVDRAFITTASLALVAACLTTSPAHAVTIDWVTVGDPGNAADTTTYGAVADSFRIMRFEFTNQQYTDFLNSVATTDNYSLYVNFGMGNNARGGITRSGSSGSYTYSVKANMGDKPVNYVSWFDAARVANWLMNGATSSSSTETGAYTLNGQTFGTVPARNPGATFYIPTLDQWYKAAYYKGGSTNAGYWDYATQSDTIPNAVTADSTGIGSAGGTGNYGNFQSDADWNNQNNGNVTTVGTNGGASAYGTFDQGGNVSEWNDLTGAAGA